MHTNLNLNLYKPEELIDEVYPNRYLGEHNDDHVLFKIVYARWYKPLYLNLPNRRFQYWLMTQSIGEDISYKYFVLGCENICNESMMSDVYGLASILNTKGFEIHNIAIIKEKAEGKQSTWLGGSKKMHNKNSKKNKKQKTKRTKRTKHNKRAQ